MSPDALDALRHAAIERARTAYLAACELDVAVRKPGNVSRQSPGHGMQAALFSASARASAGPLFRPGARVGERIEAAVAATAAAAGCNTNLGIVLLCAPIASAIERRPDAGGPAALRAAIEHVLAELDVADARAAYRAIALARPGGLGSAPAQDVRDVPTLGLRAAMALAADRDSIARQYRDGYAELFELGLSSLSSSVLFRLALDADEPVPPAVTEAVQRVFLAFLAGRPDSHIVRKHGAAVAHSVMHAAQRWQARSQAGERLDADPGFAAWDLELKAAGLNPGTSADLTVAALFVAGLLAARARLPDTPRRADGTDRDTPA
ncbi:MAG TPA: triphosphoribosyl-dephospho-CoA synthase [Burkholderiaceae bacterium]